MSMRMKGRSVEAAVSIHLKTSMWMVYSGLVAQMGEEALVSV